jgi:hypothetical protein
MSWLGMHRSERVAALALALVLALAPIAEGVPLIEYERPPGIWTKAGACLGLTFYIQVTKPIPDDCLEVDCAGDENDITLRALKTKPVCEAADIELASFGMVVEQSVIKKNDGGSCVEHQPVVKSAEEEEKAQCRGQHLGR